jgi:hypothetical protein
MARRKVHLVGSVGLGTAQEVFAVAGRLLGEHLSRVPDGEPGGRRMWTSWQYPVFRALAYFRPDFDAKPNVAGALPLKFADGMSAADVEIGELGYAREARASYQDFLAARERGDIAKTARFQVCLPTPYAVCCTLMRTDLIREVEAVYLPAMLREVEAIAAAIPHDDLCLQWDICQELVAFDGRAYLRPFPGMEDFFAQRFKVLAAAVPARAELGYHLCYGDLDAKHSLEPEDGAKMRDLAHLIRESAGRPLTYVHMPVPISRSDDAFYAPLKSLKLAEGTELFLGLVHAEDGLEGTKKRMASAAKAVERFGIASECGLSRARTPELVREYLAVHAAAAKL